MYIYSISPVGNGRLEVHLACVASVYLFKGKKVEFMGHGELK
jgi:hypothetical protein